MTQEELKQERKKNFLQRYKYIKPQVLFYIDKITSKEAYEDLMDILDEDMKKRLSLMLEEMYIIGDNAGDSECQRKREGNDYFYRNIRGVDFH